MRLFVLKLKKYFGYWVSLGFRLCKRSFYFANFNVIRSVYYIVSINSKSFNLWIVDFIKKSNSITIKLKNGKKMKCKKLSDFCKTFLIRYFCKQLLNSHLAHTLILQPIRLIYLHWKSKRFYFLFINFKIFDRKICEYFFIKWRNFNEFFHLRIWMILLNSETLNLLFKTFNILQNLAFLLRILNFFRFFLELILLIWLWILIIFIKLEWLIWILRILFRLSILLWHNYILSMYS